MSGSTIDTIALNLNNGDVVAEVMLGLGWDGDAHRYQLDDIVDAYDLFSHQRMGC